MKKKWYIVLLFTLIIIITTIFGGIGIYASTSYSASKEALEYLESDDEVEVIDNSSYISFTPQKKNLNKGLIFYPGGLVDAESYSPICSMLAKEGITCFLVRMPYQLAFFNTKACDTIRMNNSNIEDYYVMGHSLGGAALGMNNLDSYKGLILLASYTTSQVNCPVLLVKGTEDKVIKSDKYEGAKSLYKNYDELIINGGNHAGYALYGAQKGDGTATITPLEQITMTKNKVLEFIVG